MLVFLRGGGDGFWKYLLEWLWVIWKIIGRGCQLSVDADFAKLSRMPLRFSIWLLWVPFPHRLVEDFKSMINTRIRVSNLMCCCFLGCFFIKWWSWRQWYWFSCYVFETMWEGHETRDVSSPVMFNMMFKSKRIWGGLGSGKSFVKTVESVAWILFLGKKTKCVGSGVPLFAWNDKQIML